MKKIIRTLKQRSDFSVDLGQELSMSKIIEVLQKAKVDKFHFDLKGRSANLVVIEHLFREETDEEEKAREKQEKQIAINEEKAEKLLYLKLKAKYGKNDKEKKEKE